MKRSPPPIGGWIDSVRASTGAARVDTARARGGGRGEKGPPGRVHSRSGRARARIEIEDAVTAWPDFAAGQQTVCRVVDGGHPARATGQEALGKADRHGCLGQADAAQTGGGAGGSTRLAR